MYEEEEEEEESLNGHLAFTVSYLITATGTIYNLNIKVYYSNFPHLP